LDSNSTSRETDGKGKLSKHDIRDLLTPYDESIRPICITLGSMTELATSDENDGDRQTRYAQLLRNLIQAALRIQPERKCIVLTGNTKKLSMELQANVPKFQRKRLILLHEYPHEELFPLCSCVVHHGGAGTTARCLHAGIPSVITPILKWYDQGGWGITVESLGVGKCLWNITSSIEDTEKTLMELLSDTSLKRNAHKLGRLIRSDNGAKTVINVLENKLADSFTGCLTYEIKRMIARNCIKTRFRGEFR